MPSLSRTIVLAIIVAVLALVIIVAGPAACDRIRSLRAQNELNQDQGKALGNSAIDAINTQGAAAERERESEELTKSNEKEIRDAEGSNAPVNPAARDAGLRSLCRRPAYRDSERCRLLNSPPAGVAPRR
jgi:hypothetical protein